MGTKICKADHRYDHIFDELPEDQGGEGRHMCCGCAYEQGYDDAKSGRASQPRPDEWLVSQAGTVRHKDPYLAYKQGYKNGRFKSSKL